MVAFWLETALGSFSSFCNSKHMSKLSFPLLVSLTLVALFVGIGIGYWFTPEYRLSMYDKYAMDLGRADRGLDLRYINAMIAHHRGAMLLASQAEGSTRKEISSLAKEIQKNEPALIEELYHWKRDWYGDRRLVRDPVVAKLGPVDRNFDLRFLNALIAHHDAGILMTQEARTKSSRAEVLDNADAVETFLRTTGEALRAWRAEWYSVK
jgi:uncharacterized protein (DUF305 family)